ncbi:MAG: hypothetical protein ACOY4K_00690 [Pseudomonadota bacterium]
MKARPILFSGPMVRALLDGRKTQTRRIVKPQPPAEEAFFGSTFGLDRAIADGIKMYSQNDYGRLPKHPTDWELIGSVGVARNAGFPKRYRCPYGQPGDLLYVRETWASDGQGGVRYYATDDVHELRRKRASIHMPRWASRLTLEITDVRVERLQDISEVDAIAEGIEVDHVIIGANCNGGRHSEEWGDRYFFDGGDEEGYETGPEAYRALWIKINGPDSWAANPWVWVLDFKGAVHPANVDGVLEAYEAGVRRSA